jgi:N-acetylmuramoyl-L-alanine amidase
MSKYAIRRGHQRTGADGCAEDILNEIDVANAYYQIIINGLKSLGHEVLDVTPPEANRSLGDSLAYGVNMANNWGADYFISCHANSCDRTSNPVGCEVIYLGGSSKSESLAENVDSEIAKLGFKDRSAKADVRGLYELRHTNMPAIIIEPFFISSQADVDLWNSVGAENLGNAIVKGLTGQTISSLKEGWNKDDKGWWFCTDTTNKYYYRDCWQLIVTFILSFSKIPT